MFRATGAAPTACTAVPAYTAIAQVQTANHLPPTQRPRESEDLAIAADRTARGSGNTIRYLITMLKLRSFAERLVHGAKWSQLRARRQTKGSVPGCHLAHASGLQAAIAS
jgi:hypothetical protein